MLNALRDLRWYDWLWCALPLGLALTGSVFAALCGAAAFAYNLRSFTSTSDRRLKYMVAALSTITAIIVYLLGGLVLAAILTAQG